MASITPTDRTPHPVTDGEYADQSAVGPFGLFGNFTDEETRGGGASTGLILKDGNYYDPFTCRKVARQGGYNPGLDEAEHVQLFAGQAGAYTDQETGYVLMGYRYYDPNSARFLTRDPMSYDAGANLYTYCNGDPVNNVDPMGLDDATWWGQLAHWDTWSGGLGTGGAVVADTFTFGEFDSRPWRNQPGYEVSAFSASVGREALANIASAGASNLIRGARATRAVTGVVGAAARQAGPVGSALRFGGRLGSETTRAHVAAVADWFESRGWKVVAGGGRGAEEYLPAAARKGGAYADVTLSKTIGSTTRTIRINPVTTTAKLKPIARELAAARNIRRLAPGEHLFLIAKP